MPKDSYYIKLDTNAYEDPKVKILCKYHGMSGFGCYLFVVLKLRQEEDCQLEYGEFTFEALSEDMGMATGEVQKFIDDCIKFKLFKKNDTHFYSERVKRDKAKLDERRTQTSIAGKASADKRYGKTTEKPRPVVVPSSKSESLITDELSAEFKDIDIDEELKKFMLYWSEGKRKLQRPNTAFRNWLTKAREFKQEKQPAKPRRTYDDGNMEGMTIL